MKWLIVLAAIVALSRSQTYRVIPLNYGDTRYPYFFNAAQLPSMDELRAPVNMIPQLSPNVSPLKKPSTDLETPHYNKNENDQGVLPQPVERFGETADSDEKVDQNPAPPKSPVDNVSLALSQFAINVMKIMEKQSGNVVVSPYSIGTLLALLQQGAAGETQEQISKALLMNPNVSKSGFKRVSEDLQKRQSSNIFKTGNGLFLGDTFSVNPTFKQIAISDFGGDVTRVKFSRPQQAAAKINNWVAGKTNNKIDKLISPDSLGENIQLVIVNAMYFKGLWQYKFRPQATQPLEFFLPNGQKTTRQFMRMTQELRVKYDPAIDSKVLVLPFEGNQYSLVIILPSENKSISSALSSLTTDGLLAYQNMGFEETLVMLPKFTIKFESNLVSVFQQLGITNIFGPSADLTGLGNYREFSPQVSSAIQSAHFSIDEEGSVAAAASAAAAVALSYSDPPVIFKADRPFLTILWDNQTSLPLFMAKIEDPVQ